MLTFLWKTGLGRKSFVGLPIVCLTVYKLRTKSHQLLSVWRLMPIVLTGEPADQKDEWGTGSHGTLCLIRVDNVYQLEGGV